MATLADVRARVRRRLEDTGASPLWDDAELDDGLRQALDDYSQWWPQDVVAALAASGDDTSLMLPADALYVVRVVDPSGAVIPRRAASPLRYVADEEQAWEVFAGALHFTRSLFAGSYTVWYRGARAFPSLETDAFPVRGGDVPLMVAGGAVYALQIRGVEEHKRGPLPPRYTTMLRELRADYRRLWAERQRTARMRTVEING